MKTSSWLRLSLMLPCTLLVGGCGSTSPKTTTTTYSATNLQGNWLVAGALPNYADFTQPGGVAVSINVDGNALTATSSDTVGCAGNGFEAPVGNHNNDELKGTLAADGTFTLDASGELTPTDIDTTVIKGSVPTTPGGSWTGTYTVPAARTCTSQVPLTGAIAATSFSLLSGSFSGTATTIGKYSDGVLVAPGTPITMSLTLQQGGTLVGSPPIQTSLALSGSVQVQGFACFSHGSTDADDGGEVSGNNPYIGFLMDDGSILSFSGSVVAEDSSKLTFAFIDVTGGNCEGNYTFLFPEFGGTPLTLTKP
jgi:hypothetical protein